MAGGKEATTSPSLFSRHLALVPTTLGLLCAPVLAARGCSLDSSCPSSKSTARAAASPGALAGVPSLAFHHERLLQATRLLQAAGRNLALHTIVGFENPGMGLAIYGRSNNRTHRAHFLSHAVPLLHLIDRSSTSATLLTRAAVAAPPSHERRSTSGT